MVVHTQAAAYRTWYEQHAAILAPATLAPVDGRAGARADALLDAMADARVIVLGELNHWIAEKTQFRLWWLERLATRFPLVLAEELGHSDGVRVSRYLRSGDEAWIDRVPTFGWQGDARSDRVDAPTGVLRESYARYPTQRFKQAQRGFYRELRRLGLLAFHGLDVNGTTGAGYADIAASLAEQPGLLGADTTQQLTVGLARVPGESLLDEAARLAALRQRFTGQLPEVIQFDLQMLEDTLRYAVLAYPAPTYDALAPALAWREDMLKRAAARLLDGLAPGAKLVVMAHALHLVKDDGFAGGAGMASGPGGGIVHSLGHYLARERGEKVRSVWFVHGDGEDCQPFPELPNRLHYPADSLNGRLAAFGSACVLPTASAATGPAATGPAASGALAYGVGVGHLYNLIAQVDLAKQADAVFFLPAVTPLPLTEDG